MGPVNKRVPPNLCECEVAPPASSPPVPLRRPPLPRPREPGLASATRRVQANGDPAETMHERSALLGGAGQSLGRVETVSCDRYSRPRSAVAAARSPLALDQPLR